MERLLIFRMAHGQSGSRPTDVILRQRDLRMKLIFSIVLGNCTKPVFFLEFLNNMLRMGSSIPWWVKNSFLKLHKIGCSYEWFLVGFEEQFYLPGVPCTDRSMALSTENWRLTWRCISQISKDNLPNILKTTIFFQIRDVNKKKTSFALRRSSDSNIYFDQTETYISHALETIQETCVILSEDSSSSWFCVFLEISDWSLFDSAKKRKTTRRRTGPSSVLRVLSRTRCRRVLKWWWTTCRSTPARTATDPRPCPYGVRRLRRRWRKTSFILLTPTSLVRFWMRFLLGPIWYFLHYPSQKLYNSVEAQYVWFGVWSWT